MIHLCEWWSIITLCYWALVLCRLCPVSTWLSILDLFDFSISPTFIFKRNMMHLCEWWYLITLYYWGFVLCIVGPVSTWLSILDFDISISLTFIFKRDMIHLCEWWYLIDLTYLYKSQCTSRSWSCLIFRIHYKSVLTSDGRTFISILSLK
jgi:hypothetical protein